MRRVLVLFLLVCSCLLTGCFDQDNTDARTEKLAAFSVTIPQGWRTNIPEGIECIRSRCVAGFTSPSGSSATVSVIPSLGKTLKEIVEESNAGMARKEVAMTVVSQSPTRVEYRGTIKEAEARVLAVIDEKSQEVGILLLSGTDSGLDEIASSIEMVNPALCLFPKGAASDK